MLLLLCRAGTYASSTTHLSQVALLSCGPLLSQVPLFVQHPLLLEDVAPLLQRTVALPGGKDSRGQGKRVLACNWLEHSVVAPPHCLPTPPPPSCCARYAAAGQVILQQDHIMHSVMSRFCPLLLQAKSSCSRITSCTARCSSSRGWWTCPCRPVHLYQL